MISVIRYLCLLLLCLLPISELYARLIPANDYELKINIPSRRLELYQKGEYIKDYPVGVGKSPQMATPIGTFTVHTRIENPVWEHPYKPVGASRIKDSSHNPLGQYWIGFHNAKNGGAYGIHGTNEPQTVGRFVSHGCVRMRGGDIAELFRIIPEGTPVYVTYQRWQLTREGDRIYIEIYPDPYGRGAPKATDIISDIYAETTNPKNIHLYRDEISRATKDNGYSGLLYNVGAFVTEIESE